MRPHSPLPAGRAQRVSRTGLAALVIANLFVAFQALRHEWGYYETLLIYWSEVVILGGYNVVRMMVVGVFGAGFFALPAMLRLDGGAGTSIFRALSAAGPGLLLAIGALCLSHGVSFVRNFLAGREYHRLSIASLVFWPYARMALVGMVLLAGIAAASLMPALAPETAFAVVMVLLKLLADVVSHTLEHRGLTGDAPNPPMTPVAAE